MGTGIPTLIPTIPGSARLTNSRGVAAEGEDGPAVAELTRVHQLHAFLKVPDPLNAQHRPKDLVYPDPHLRLDTVEHCGTDEEPLLTARDRSISSVQHQLGALRQSFVDPFQHEPPVLVGYQRPQISARLPSGPELERRRPFDDRLHQLVGDLLLDADDRKGHATLASAAKRRI